MRQRKGRCTVSPEKARVAVQGGFYERIVPNLSGRDMCGTCGKLSPTVANPGGTCAVCGVKRRAEGREDS
jgi:hypothetical protein